MSLTLFWYSSVFSFSIVDFEQVKSQLGKTMMLINGEDVIDVVQVSLLLTSNTFHVLI